MDIPTTERSFLFPMSGSSLEKRYMEEVKKIPEPFLGFHLIENVKKDELSSLNTDLEKKEDKMEIETPEKSSWNNKEILFSSEKSDSNVSSTLTWGEDTDFANINKELLEKDEFSSFETLPEEGLGEKEEDFVKEMDNFLVEEDTNEEITPSHEEMSGEETPLEEGSTVEEEDHQLIMEEEMPELEEESHILKDNLLEEKEEDFVKEMDSFLGEEDSSEETMPSHEEMNEEEPLEEGSTVVEEEDQQAIIEEKMLEGQEEIHEVVEEGIDEMKEKSDTQEESTLEDLIDNHEEVIPSNELLEKEIEIYEDEDKSENEFNKESNHPILRGAIDNGVKEHPSLQAHDEWLKDVQTRVSEISNHDKDISIESQIDFLLERVVSLQEQEIHAENLLLEKRRELEDVLIKVDTLIEQLPKEQGIEFEKKKYHSLYGKVYDRLGI